MMKLNVGVSKARWIVMLKALSPWGVGMLKAISPWAVRSFGVLGYAVWANQCSNVFYDADGQYFTSILGKNV